MMGNYISTALSAIILMMLLPLAALQCVSPLLKLPLQITTENEGSRWSLSFILCLGDNLVEKTAVFCSEHFDICSPSLSVLIMTNSIKNLLVLHPSTEIMSISYLDGNQRHRVFSVDPVDIQSSLDAAISDTCSFYGLVVTDPLCSEITLRFLEEIWKYVDLVIRRHHESYFNIQARTILQDEKVIFLIDPPNPFSFPPGLGSPNVTPIISCFVLNIICSFQIQEMFSKDSGIRIVFMKIPGLRISMDIF